MGYHFADMSFTELGPLARAMRERWSEAVRVLADPDRFAELGAWVAALPEPHGVDPALFTGRVEDPDVTLVWFLAQARPELPPFFRGRPAELQDLRLLFADPARVMNGGAWAEEAARSARPEVLRALGSHEGAEEHAHLARDLVRAEEEALRVREELESQFVSWEGALLNVDRSLLVAFLLDGSLIRPPGIIGHDEFAHGWTRYLWSRVEGTSPSERTKRVGRAVAAYALMPKVRRLAHEHGELTMAIQGDVAHEWQMKDQVNRRALLNFLKAVLPVSAVLLTVFGVMGILSGPGEEVRGWVSLVLGWAASAGTLVMTARGGYGTHTWLRWKALTKTADQVFERTPERVAAHIERIRVLEDDLLRTGYAGPASPYGLGPGR